MNERMDGRMHLRIDKDIKKEFIKCSKKDGLDPSVMIRLWIMQYLQSKERKQN